jgi:hypothetical protein
MNKMPGRSLAFAFLQPSTMVAIMKAMRFIAVVLAALLTLAASRPTSAQDPSSSTSPAVADASGNSFAAGAMSVEVLRALRREQISALHSADPAITSQAMTNIIHLATFYGEKVDFRSSAPRLFELYATAPLERPRVLALACLYAVGHADTMAHVAQVAQLQPSARLRRLGHSAVAAYYAAPRIHVGTPTRVAI